MEPWGIVVALSVAFIGGSGFSKIVEVISDRVKGASARRRAEVDSMAAQLAQAFTDKELARAAEERSSRRERVALEQVSELRRMLLDRGVPSSELPILNLGD